MKKLLYMLLILFVLYLGIQIVFNFFSKGHENEYELEVDNNKFKIKEISNFEEKNYYFEIKSKENKFKFQTHYDFKRGKNVIEDIKYFKDEMYECILPIFKNNQIVLDMMCINNGITYYYHDIVSKNDKLDEFIKSIENYDLNRYIDNTEKKSIEGIEVYKQNLIKDHYIGISNYKGIYNISNNFNSLVYDITLFEKDIYNQKLGTFIDQYYIVADYNEEYEFNEFKLIDLVTLNTETIKSDTSITFDGYIQGTVEDKVYLFDKDRKNQFEINVNKQTIIKNNKDNLRYYSNGEFSKMQLNDALEEKKFITNEVDYKNDEYQRIDKVGNETGYYYLYKNNGSGYDAYRINIQDKEGLTYLFTTNSIDNIFYIDNYIYFINNAKVQVYNDEFGVKNLIEYRELEFNKDILFNVYSK